MTFQRWILFSAIAAGFVLRLVFALVTPVGGEQIPGELSAYNDELAHVQYTSHLLKTGELPGHREAITEPGALARGYFENYQPPLFYLLNAGVASAFGVEGDAALTYTGRLLSVVLSIGLLWVFVLIARDLNLSFCGTAAGLIFVSLGPVLIRFNSTAGNDTLFWLLGGGIVYVSLRIAKPGIHSTDWILLGLLLTMGIYTKLSTLLLIPLPIIALISSANYRRLITIAVVLLLVSAATLPLWLRNLNEFGSLIPLDAGFGPAFWRLPRFDSLSYALRSMIFPWSEFWHGWLGFLILLFSAVVVVSGCVRHSFHLNATARAILFANFFIVLAAFLWLNSRYDQAEGRYLFAAWPAMALAVSGIGQSNRSLLLISIALILPHILFLI